MNCLFIRRLGVDPLATPDTMASIARVVAEKHGLTVADLKGPARKRQISWPRQEAMWRMRQVRRSDGSPRYSTSQVGDFLGWRDHTTVVHGEREHQKRLDAAAGADLGAWRNLGAPKPR